MCHFCKKIYFFINLLSHDMEISFYIVQTNCEQQQNKTTVNNMNIERYGKRNHTLYKRNRSEKYKNCGEKCVTV